MTIALAALSAVLALLVVILAALLVTRRAARADERIAAAVADMNTRMESMVRELNEALEAAERESKRSRVLGDLAGSSDVDDVLARVVEVASGVGGADPAPVARREDGTGKRNEATLALGAE